VTLVFRGIRKPDIFSWSAFFFLLSIFLYLQLILLIEATFAERFLFLPSLPFALALVCLAIKHKLLLWLLIPFGGFWAYQPWARVPDWKDNRHLFKADIDKVPNSIRANSALAYSLYEQAISGEEVNEPLLQKSAEYFRTALNIYGKDGNTWYNYG